MLGPFAFEQFVTRSTVIRRAGMGEMHPSFLRDTRISIRIVTKVKTYTRSLVSLAVVITASALLTTPAHADIPGATSTLPTALTVTSRTSVPFTVTSPVEICYVSQSAGYARDLGGGSYELELDPSDLPFGTSEQSVTVYDCEDNAQTFPVSVTFPFTLTASTIVAPWAQDTDLRKLEIEASAAPSTPLTVTLLRDNKAVLSKTIDTEGSLLLPISRRQAAGDWKIRAEAGGTVIEQPLEVAYKWAPLSDRNDPKHFTRCSTVTWHYNGAKAPKNTGGMKADIAKALEKVSAATGLTFREVPADASPLLELHWVDLGAHGPSALGGYNYSSSGDTMTYTGNVQLNTKDWWVTKKGFGRYNGMPGRGALLLHEIGHTLGLGHVEDRNSIMNPVSSSGSPTGYTKGDLAGLDYLYAPASCA